MATQQHSSGNRSYSRLSRAACLALCACTVSTAALAEDFSATRQLLPGIQVRTATFLESLDGETQSYATLGTQLSIERTFLHQSVDVGLFADLELTSLRSGSFANLFGGWAGYRTGRWQVSATAAYFASDQLSGVEIYAAKVQLEFRPGHRLALAAAGALQGGSSPAVRVIYKTRLANRASIAFSVGIGSSRPLDYGAATGLTWNLL
ncbi:MAG: hypothetical protein ACR2QS_12010 [Woeseiaceae bacterium]